MVRFSVIVHGLFLAHISARGKQNSVGIGRSQFRLTSEIDCSPLKHKQKSLAFVGEIMGTYLEIGEYQFFSVASCEGVLLFCFY
jgi:hypothetical protein